MKRLLGACAVVALVAAGYLLYQQRRASDTAVSAVNPQSTQASSQNRSASADDGQSRTTSYQTSSVAVDRPQSLRPAKSAQQLFATSGDFAATYQALLGSADPDAPYFAAETAGLCRTFYDSNAQRFIDPTRQDSWNRITALSDRPEQAARTLIARCGAWQGPLPTGGETRQLRLRAAEANGPTGKALLVSTLLDQGKRDEATAIATEVFRKQKGYAFPLVSQALRDSAGAWTITAVRSNRFDLLNLSAPPKGR